MRITLLTDVEAKKPRDYDPVVRQVAAALRKNDHKVRILGVTGDLKKLVSKLTSHGTDLIFNLVESFGKNDRGDVGVTALLELLNIPFTGSGTGGLYLTQDKALCKKILAFEKILYPDFAVFSLDADLEVGGNLRMPLFVKPLRADASIGIDENALVTDSNAMMQKIQDIHADCKDSALVEEYIDGREFYVGILGNRDAIAFPPVEVDFSGLPDGIPRFMNSKAKWDEESPEYKGTNSVIADVPDELRARLQAVSLDAFRALRLRGYARVDLRLTETNEIYVIEVNANCYLEESGEFAMAARAAGIEYAGLIEKIVESAIERYKR